MMSKPAPSASSEEEEKSAASASTAKPQGQGTVADLERRLAMLSTAEEAAAANAATAETPQAPTAAAAIAPPAAKSGKNALLVSNTVSYHRTKARVTRSVPFVWCHVRLQLQSHQNKTPKYVFSCCDL